MPVYKRQGLHPLTQVFLLPYLNAHIPPLVRRLYSAHSVVGQPAKAERFYGARGERLYTIQSCAAVVENMLLAANDLGLGACWVGAFDEEGNP